MDRLEHDPRTKQQVKDALYEFVYAPVQRQFKARLDAIIIKNTLMGGYGHRHFIYRGEVYNIEETPPPVRKNRLQPALRVPMEEYLADVTELNQHELPYVLNFITQVLNSSCDLNDYMRVLPESVHYPLNQLASTCPCRSTTLAEDKVAHLMAKNQEPINMIKRRLVTNLLI